MQDILKQKLDRSYAYSGLFFRLALIFVTAVALILVFAYTTGASTYQGNCAPYAYKQCAGKSLYWYDSCGNQQDAQYCPNGCWNNQCQDYNYSCAYHAYKNCIGNNLQWYDSCGNKQDSQYCSNGCYDNRCQNQSQNQNYNQNYNFNYNYGNCVSRAYKLCVRNSIYWYDSCGNQQDLFQSCYGANQTCQYGQCVYQPSAPIYVVYYTTACYQNNLYWYDSLGAATGLYKSCLDSNSCTQDACSGSKCSNIAKCDGSTCATGSADYIKYCASDKSHCGNGTCEGNLGETLATCPSDCAINLSISFFAKQDANSTQWQKTAQAGQNSQIYFMATVMNNGTGPVEDASISADIPANVASLGNVKIDGIAVSRDIATGINVGPLPALSSKTITFEGRTQGFLIQETKQATVKIIANSATKTDSLDIIFNPNQGLGAAVSGAATSGVWEFLKRWYLWILVGAVLVFLFIVVFRRLSVTS